MVTDLQIAQEETVLETINLQETQKNLLRETHVVTQNQLEVAETMPLTKTQDLVDQIATQALQEAEALVAIQPRQEVVLTEVLVLLQAEEAQEVDDNLNQLF